MTHRLLIGVLLSALACAPDAPLPPEPVAPPSTLNVESGQLSIESGALQFLPCGEVAAVTLADGTNGDAAAIIEELGGEQGIPALVIRDGERLVEVRHASPEGRECQGLQPNVEMVALGEEPFWSVRIDAGVATVSTPEESDGVAYIGGRWSRPDSLRWRYEATREKEILTLELTESRCADGMSGARYPFRAVLTRAGIAMQGCGLDGKAAPP